MALSERLLGDGECDEIEARGSSYWLCSTSGQCEDGATWMFEELPKATIVSVSKPDTGDISPILLSYTIEFQYKQFKWRLAKKASQVLYLHFALKKRAFIEEIYEKQEQVKEWLQSLGIGERTSVVHDEPLEEAVPSCQIDSHKNRCVPTRAVLPVLRPALGSQLTATDRAKEAMQGYLNHFLGNMDIANSRQVCKFMEVSKLSFLKEYGPKLKEGYMMVKHLPRSADASGACVPFSWLQFCSAKWQKVWVVLKPGFLAFLEDPFDAELLDIISFDVLPMEKSGKCKVAIADETQELKSLYYSFKVICGNRTVELRTTSSVKVREWAAAINDVSQKPPDGWCIPRRFGSYAPSRGITDDGSQAQWFVDGKVVFEAIASSIEGAKSKIFITGWWLCPELYLRRPFQKHASSRLDSLLEAKAKQGVQIYILLYKEVAIALKINSLYSKKKLLQIHKNVKVVRFPDHLASGVYLWSHHEKLVIVDYHVCYIGGLDLCFGRYDTIEHKMEDCPPVIWPGKDYYNPRESEPNSWEDTMDDELNRRDYPRMPWHDVHCALWGPPCLDVARHFVQRWNFAKRSKAPNEQAIPLLMPHHHMVLPHYMERSKEMDIENRERERDNRDEYLPSSFESHTTSEDIPLLLPQEVEEIHSTLEEKTTGLDMTSDGSRLLKDPSEMHSGFMDESDMQTLSDLWERDEQDNHASLEDNHGQIGERLSCRCQIIRSVSQWSAGTSQTEDSIHSAYCSFIENAEHFIYIENQFFVSGLAGDQVIQNRVLDSIYKRILRAHREKKCFRVIVVIPLLPGFQGGLEDGGAATVRALTHWQYRTISRGKPSILYNLNKLLGPKTQEYISFYGLRNYGRLSDEGPVVTSQVYVHSKVMIIDDRTTFIGSSNINDRSLLGSRDSEIGVIIEDKEFLESTMNGEPWTAGKFTHSLRVSLWAEHLGLSKRETSQIYDPIADATYRDSWLATAKANAAIYHEVFACIPNDEIHSRAALRQVRSQWKEKYGHNTIDLGTAPTRLKLPEKTENEEVTTVTDPMERLKTVRGFLVCFPLDFMRDEDLRPMFNEGEFYASPQVFL
ncbi:unnamed protein product [Rhodiola kirilowii]